MSNNTNREMLPPIEIEGDLKHLIRVEAAHEGISMSEFVRRGVEERATRRRNERHQATAEAA